MKHSITPELAANGKPLLRFQCAGFNDPLALNALRDSYLTAVALGKTVTFSAVWTLQLAFDNGVLLEFSASATALSGWEEFGSLNILMDRPPYSSVADSSNLNLRYSITNFLIVNLEKLIWEQNEVITECGLIFTSKSGIQMIIAAGIPSCSVTLSSSFSGDDFKPLYPIDECRREFL